MFLKEAFLSYSAGLEGVSRKRRIGMKTTRQRILLCITRSSFNPFQEILDFYIRKVFECLNKPDDTFLVTFDETKNVKFDFHKCTENNLLFAL